MKSVIKNKNSWLYKFLVKDFKLFGGIEIYSGCYESEISTTCDIRKQFIMACIKIFISSMMCIIVGTVITAVLVVLPLQALFFGLYMGFIQYFSITGDAVLPFTAVGVAIDLLIMYIALSVYIEHTDNKFTTKCKDLLNRDYVVVRVVNDIFEILKENLCSKVEWK